MVRRRFFDVGEIKLKNKGFLKKRYEKRTRRPRTIFFYDIIRRVSSTQSNKRICVFIDASNLWESQKARGKFFDYQKLRDFLKTKFGGSSITVFFYTAYPAEGTRDYSMDGRHKFYTFLKKGLNFNVRKKELKRIVVTTKVGEAIEEKGNMDVEITIDALHNKDKYNIAVFFSGDSDFLALISYLRRGGKKVYVFSSRNNISEELRTGSDGYTDVLTVKEDIWGRDLVHREKIGISN